MRNLSGQIRVTQNLGATVLTVKRVRRRNLLRRIFVGFAQQGCFHCHGLDNIAVRILGLTNFRRLLKIKKAANMKKLSGQIEFYLCVCWPMWKFKGS
jgi:hypothetical protein